MKLTSEEKEVERLIESLEGRGVPLAYIAETLESTLSLDIDDYALAALGLLAPLDRVVP